MILIKNVDLYNPKHIGISDIVIAGGKIERIGKNLPNYDGAKVIDGAGLIAAPGLIDRHVHITGGGGEGSFKTQAPPVQLSDLIKGGITTVVGLLGTDGISRSVENLLAKTKSLKEEGISAYCLSGAYGYPSPTITGTLSKDIMFIEEMLGVKLALSDHRAPNISTDELIRLASDVRTAGMLSGKPGFICIHMGDDEHTLEPVFEAIERTSIPIKTFQPTHVGRNETLRKKAMEFAKMGGTIDFSCGDSYEELQKVSSFLQDAKKEGVPWSNITISSDGQGSWSSYDCEGHLTGYGISEVNLMIKQIANLCNEYGENLEDALKLGTENVAKALEIYPEKGCISEESDADILLLDRELSINYVIANGKIMMSDKELVAKGTFEK